MQGKSPESSVTWEGQQGTVGAVTILDQKTKKRGQGGLNEETYLTGSGRDTGSLEGPHRRGVGELVP